MKKPQQAILYLLAGLLLAFSGVEESRSGELHPPPCPNCPAANTGSRDALFTQSAARVLDKESADGISYLLLDAQSGKLIASDWPELKQPIPFGSLLKPFLALAYGQRHNFNFPTHFCRGTSSGCWLPRGHGKSDLESAVSNSCNSYFRMLAANMTGEDLRPTAQSFGLNAPGAAVSGAALFGVGDDWLISPLRMADAYLELSRRRGQPGVKDVLAGMSDSGHEGTGLEIDRALLHSRALVKTGTAVCTHKNRAPGDGFVVAMLPEDQPRILFLVRAHGMPGAKASAIAGRMLRSLGE